jgi:hypothetical protein
MARKKVTKHKKTASASSEVDGDTYFSGLIERAAQAFSKKYPSGDPYSDFVVQAEGVSPPDAQEEPYVSVEIRRMRSQYRPSVQFVDGERDTLLKYREKLCGLRDFLADKDLGQPSFRGALEKEVYLVVHAVSALASLRGDRAARHHYYNYALYRVVSLLSSFGLRGPNPEAAKVLWFSGWRELAQAGAVWVIDPFENPSTLGNRVSHRWRGKTSSTGKPSQRGLWAARMLHPQQYLEEILERAGVHRWWEEEAPRLLGWIGNRKEVTAHEVARHLRSYRGAKGSVRAEADLRRLTEAGRLVPVEIPAGAKGGRPKTVYRVATKPPVSSAAQILASSPPGDPVRVTGMGPPQH